PTAIRLCSLRQMDLLYDALIDLGAAFHKKAADFHNVLKSGRTHLQDAVPMRLGSEFAAWEEVVLHCAWTLGTGIEFLTSLGIGGNGIGSGVITPEGNANRLVEVLNEQIAVDRVTAIEVELHSSKNLYERTQSCADFAQLSGNLRTIAIELGRIANDIRLLASGPNTGLAEIVLPPVQPGSSIMP